MGKDAEAKLKKEYGGMVVNTRKVGDAIMVGTDIAIMPVRVIGQQVRIGVVSKSGLLVAREEKFREIMAEKKAEGPNKFQKLYRNLVKAKVVAYYSLGLSDILESEEIASPSDFAEYDDSTTVVKYGSKLEADAFAKGAELSRSGCRVSVEEIRREWYVILQHFSDKTAGHENNDPHRFYDFSFQWDEL